jgi:arylsulfatase A-like enzyme
MALSKIPTSVYLIFLVLGLLIGTVVVWLQSGQPLQEPARHIVLVVMDTVRADRLSLYGYSRETTPFLKELASESMVFRRAKATAPWTVPSHASMFTGLWPSEHRAQWGRMVLDESHLTLAEVLHAEGFSTVGLSSNDFITEANGFGQGFEDFRRIRGDQKIRTKRILADLPEILDELVQRDKRFFLFVNLMDAHIPFNAAKYAFKFGLKATRDATGDHDTKWKINAGQLAYEAGLREQQNAAYAAAIRYLDDAIRSIVGMLTERHLLDDTVLIITSDHGEGLGDHPELGHSISTWEEQLAIPLLVRFPGGQGGGQVLSSMTSLIALAPTVLDWLDVHRPANWIERPDFLGTSRSGISADYRSYFSEVTRRKNTGMAKRYPELASRVQHTHVLYCDPFKFSVNASGKVRFYDLNRDPKEKEDLASDSILELEVCDSTYRALLASGRYTPFEERESDKERERSHEAFDDEALRALGYIQ